MERVSAWLHTRNPSDVSVATDRVSLALNQPFLPGILVYQDFLPGILQVTLFPKMIHVLAYQLTGCPQVLCKHFVRQGRHAN
jgi:hypothetical protein